MMYLVLVTILRDLVVLVVVRVRFFGLVRTRRSVYHHFQIFTLMGRSAEAREVHARRGAKVDVK
jgi:hypothetical protein